MDDHEADDPVDVEESPVARTVLLLAQTLRREFGVDIDAHPGGAGAEAGAINRAFRASVGVVLAGAVPPGEMSEFGTRVLEIAARRRLAELGVGADVAARLLASEPDLDDRWLAYLALAPDSAVEDMMRIEP
ncbi:MAG: hypothetical protein BGO49_20795 [Planctomycetales bacterium 71-10]|nr:MAG: hypothetical protein BGO49_20795 [Planctomycetales bacterium 71-10]